MDGEQVARQQVEQQLEQVYQYQVMGQDMQHGIKQQPEAYLIIRTVELGQL